eukprot:13476-Heterococcus_DN1.PRE.2
MVLHTHWRHECSAAVAARSIGHAVDANNGSSSTTTLGTTRIAKHRSGFVQYIERHTRSHTQQQSFGSMLSDNHTGSEQDVAASKLSSVRNTHICFMYYNCHLKDVPPLIFDAISEGRYDRHRHIWHTVAYTTHSVLLLLSTLQRNSSV